MIRPFVAAALRASASDCHSRLELWRAHVGAGPVVDANRLLLSGIADGFDDLAATATLGARLAFDTTGAVASAADVLGRLRCPGRRFIPWVPAAVRTARCRPPHAIIAHLRPPIRQTRRADQLPNLRRAA